MSPIAINHSQVAVSPPDILEIYVGTTWFSFEVDRTTGLTKTGLSVKGFVRSRLTQYQFDPRLSVWVPVNNFSKYNKFDKKAYFPRYFLDSFLASLPYGTKYNLTQVQPYPARSTKIHMKKTFVPRDMQEQCAEFVEKHKFAPISVMTGGGKGLRHGTPVKVPGGWKNIEDLKVGDEVTAWDGTVAKVSGVYPQGLEDTFKVTVGKEDRCLSADSVHLWTARVNQIVVYDAVSTHDLIDFLRIGAVVELPVYKGNWTKWEPLLSVELEDERHLCTCIRIDHPDKLYVAGDYIVTHNTVAATYAASRLQGPALIVLGMLIPQWYKSLKQFTTLKNDDICVVQGFDSLAAIWKMVEKKFMPKVVLFSTRTLILYIEREPPYNSIPSFEEFQRVLGFKVKVMDEVHMNFFANTKIDLFSNIEYNIYLSATYQRTDSIGRKIFDTIYPPTMRFGEQFGTKYTTVTMVQYNLSISAKHLNKFKRINGYMHALYEKFLLKYKSFYNDFLERVLLPLIHQFFINCRKDGQRLLILCQTRDFASKVYQDVKLSFTELKVNKYFAGGKGKETDLKNLESDIIVSTIKSCGTGRDIKDLKTCINTVSFSSEPLASQVMGRLRELKGEDTFFVDMWNGDIPTHKHHKRSRLEVYKKKALKVFDTII